MRVIYFIFIFIFFATCSPKINNLNFGSRPSKVKINLNSKLKLNGAYYHVDNQYSDLNIFFFYENFICRSVTIDSSNFKKDRIADGINKIVSEFMAMSKQNGDYFEDGGYSTNNLSFSIESIRYIPQLSWGVITYKGKIVNDTTILITGFEFPERKIHNTDSSYYRFIQTNKPDSLKYSRWKNKNWYWAKY